MKVVAIIPARFGSSRFPGKPLAQVQGKSMIMRVYDQCKKSDKLSDVCVATDDERIFNHVMECGGKAVMTGVKHNSGTDRCWEAYAGLGDEYDVVVNVQGDEPFIQPEQIDLLVDLFIDDTVQIGTLVKKIEQEEELHDSNVPKVVFDERDFAMYFSRSTIPYYRNLSSEEWFAKGLFYKHIGIYAFQTEVLEQVTKIQQAQLELSESLEQLRWLSHGFKIKVARTVLETEGIDTPEQLAQLNKEE